jgi:hypothetical protein
MSEGTEENHKIPWLDSQCPDRDLNQAPSKYKSRALPYISSSQTFLSTTQSFKSHLPCGSNGSGAYSAPQQTATDL